MLRQEFAKGLRIHPFALLSPSNKMISSFMTPSRITVLFSVAVLFLSEKSPLLLTAFEGLQAGVLYASPAFVPMLLFWQGSFLD